MTRDEGDEGDEGERLETRETREATHDKTVVLVSHRMNQSLVSIARLPLSHLAMIAWMIAMKKVLRKRKKSLNHFLLSGIK